MSDSVSFPQSANMRVFPGMTEIGMTKRELFAAMAMQGLIANSEHALLVNSHRERARVAVASADALLEELNKGEQS